jgi:nitroreductase
VDFFETVRNRFSTRRFSSEPVPEQDLRRMLEAAVQAPNATNDQPWHFVVIREDAMKQTMKDIVIAVLDAAISAAHDPARRERLTRMRNYSVHFAEAPAAVAVLARPWTGGSGAQSDLTARDLGLESASMAAAHLLLASTALGYGGCFASAPAEFAREELEAVLGVEQPWFLVGVVSLGMPRGSRLRKAPRKPLEDVCTFIG